MSSTDNLIADSSRSGDTARRICYVMTVFPTVTETFTLNEMLEVERHGIEIVPASLGQPRDRVTHRSALGMASRTEYLHLGPIRLLMSNLRMFLRSPRRYLSALMYCFSGHPTSWITVTPGRTATWKALLLFPCLAELAERLDRMNVSHLHATSASIAGTAAIILSKLLGRPYSLTGHGQDLWAYPPDDLSRRIERAAFFTTVAEHNRRRILETYPEVRPETIRLIRLGTRLDQFERAADGPRSMHEETPIVLTIARLEPVKGHDVLLRSAKQLVGRGIPFHWLLVGDGSLRSSLESEVAAAGLKERLEFAGFLRHEEVLALYRRAHLCVLSSRSEGLPIVLMEALAASVPCIATSVGGVPEIVEHGVNGLLVPPDNPAELSEAIETLLLDPPLRARMARAARNSIVSRYDIRNTGEAMARLFRQSIRS